MNTTYIRWTKGGIVDERNSVLAPSISVDKHVRSRNKVKIRLTFMNQVVKPET